MDADQQGSLVMKLIMSCDSFTSPPREGFISVAPCSALDCAALLQRRLAESDACSRPGPINSTHSGELVHGGGGGGFTSTPQKTGQKYIHISICVCTSPMLALTNETKPNLPQKPVIDCFLSELFLISDTKASPAAPRSTSYQPHAH